MSHNARCSGADVTGLQLDSSQVAPVVIVKRP
jgi:hypothetical protein